MTTAPETSERRRSASPRALAAAEEILARWIDQCGTAPLDRLVQSELRSRRHLNSAERRWVAEAVFGSVRFWRRQTRILSRVGHDTSARARIALWARSSEEGDADIAAAIASLAGADTPADFLRETLSFSDAMADALEAALGAEAPLAGQAFNEQAPTTLRVNTLRATRNHVLERLTSARPTRFSPWGVELGSRVNLHDLPGYRTGCFEVQEEASQLVALLTDARPGQTVVDIGAGAGGKSLAIAAMMGNKGRLVSADTSQDRLARLRARAERGGVKIVQPLHIVANGEGRWQLSETEKRNLNVLRKHTDCVLVDAPCSGSGVVRRSPDIKWRAIDLGQFARLQTLLLEQSAALVAQGGSLIYATCAYERAQDEAVVEDFLRSDAGSEFEIVSALPRLVAAVQRVTAREDSEQRAAAELSARLETLLSGPFLRTWPHRHNLDAFFAACFVRKKQPAVEP